MSFFSAIDEIRSKSESGITLPQGLLGELTIIKRVLLVIKHSSSSMSALKPLTSFNFRGIDVPPHN